MSDSYEDRLALLQSRFDAVLVVVSQHPDVAAEVARAIADPPPPGPDTVKDARLNALEAVWDSAVEKLGEG